MPFDCANVNKLQYISYQYVFLFIYPNYHLLRSRSDVNICPYIIMKHCVKCHLCSYSKKKKKNLKHDMNKVHVNAPF